MEDRGLLQQTEDDEEAIYSAVLGSGAYQSEPKIGFFNRNKDTAKEEKKDEKKNNNDKKERKEKF